MQFTWEDPEHSLLEAVLSRGDRRLGEGDTSAWQLGARFDAWHEHYDWSRWLQAFEETGVDPEFYAYRTVDPWETLPWSHINIGVTDSYLRGEWLKTLKGETTPDCHKQPCNVCGVQAQNAEDCLNRLDLRLAAKGKAPQDREGLIRPMGMSRSLTVCEIRQAGLPFHSGEPRATITRIRQGRSHRRGPNWSSTRSRQVALRGILAVERVQTGATFFPMGDGFVADPYPPYRRLREKDPVHRSQLINGWVLTRHADISAVLRDPRFLADERKQLGYEKIRAQAIKQGIIDADGIGHDVDAARRPAGPHAPARRW